MTQKTTENLIIFGQGDLAELAHFYFSTDTGYNLVGFSVDREFHEQDRYLDLPVIPFDRIQDHFPPDDCAMFVALSYAKMNTVREMKCTEAKARGYRLASYISSRATTFDNFSCGENCFILEDNTIQPFAEIGNNVTLWSGNHIGHHSVIEDNVFIASHVVISGGVRVGKNCFIGVNSTLRDHIALGNHTLVGAASYISADTDANGVYIGNPAVKHRIPSTRLKKI